MIFAAVTESRTMRVIWDYIQEQLFCPETNLFYDYITDREPSRRFRHLPTPAEIARQFPNPCGWGTGMEDCMLNAGSVMEILKLRRELFGEENREFAERVLDGIYRCATVHGKPGFIVRGISPYDGKSCYFNTSRDQLTFAVYGVWRFLQGYPDASGAAKEKARFILAAVAELCRERNRPEHGFNLGRLDGGPAVVSQLWNCAPHEMMRLPMFYGAAYLATGRERYRGWMRELAGPGLDATLRMDPDAHWWDFSLSQMLLSLRFMQESGLSPEFDDKIGEAMRRGVELTRRDIRRKLVQAEAYPGSWETLNTNWRQLPMAMTPETVSQGGTESTFGGFSYLNPCFPPEFREPNSFLRAFGNDLFALFCGGALPDEEELRRIEALLARVDFSRCGGAGPVQLLHAAHIGLTFGIEFLSSRR